MSEEQKNKLTQAMNDLNKYNTSIAKIITAAETYLSGNPSNADVMMMNLDKLKEIGEESEEVIAQGQTLAHSKCFKRAGYVSTCLKRAG